MTSSVFTKKYSKFKDLITEYRKNSGVTQQGLADMLGKPQSYVSKYESGERRLDIVEFIDISRSLKFDICEFLTILEEEISQ
jgi:transcriptional regulator with XRE-family HTH domain